MSTVNPDLEHGNGGDPVEPSEAKPAEAAPAEANSDPLDAIADEEQRAQAKRDRAIAQRVARREADEAEPEEEPKEEPISSNYVTKDDMKRRATTEAKDLVAPEILETWDELTKVPLGGFDAMDPKSIAKNMQQRYTIYLAENPAEGEDPTKDLQTSTHVPTSGGPKAKTSEKKPAPTLPGYKESAQPEDWYPA